MARRVRRGTALDPIITMNDQGVIQSASDSMREVFGWTPDELLGKNVKVLIPEPRRSALDRYLDRYRHADVAKTLTRTRRFDAIRKDGRGIQIELSMSRADLPAHAGPYFIGIVRDVTSEIDVSPSSPADRTRLQQLITAQTCALASANLRLQMADRLAALGTLAAGLGHDMNNVLLPVRAHLNAIEHKGLPDAAAPHLVAIRRSIAYLQHLSDGLHFLALDPDDSGAADRAELSTNLRSWWDTVGNLLRKALPKRVRIQVSLPATLPLAAIAPHWLTQAVLSLIVNAGEALPAVRARPTVSIRGVPSGDGQSIRLSVADNGTGMTPEVRRRALDLFFTTKPRRMSTGLGLTLTQRVVRRARGELEIASELGKGSTVTLVIPIAPHSPNVPADTRPAVVAVITLRNHRTSALVAQVLLLAGVHIKPAGASGLGMAQLWVTEPTRAALSNATRWRAARAETRLVLLGPPPQRDLAGWTALNPTIIDPPDDFPTIRGTLAEIVSRLAPPALESP